MGGCWSGSGSQRGNFGSGGREKDGDSKERRDNKAAAVYCGIVHKEKSRGRLFRSGGSGILGRRVESVSSDARRVDPALPKRPSVASTKTLRRAADFLFLSTLSIDSARQYKALGSSGDFRHSVC